MFHPNVEQPFQAHAWAVASNRTGQLVAHAHGTQFEQLRTMPDGGPLSVTTSQTYLFNGDNQGRQTLRIEQSISELTHWWSDAESRFTLDGSDDLRARSCLDMRPGIFWDNLCNISVTADIRLSTQSGSHIAEADVSATWDATINGDTAGIRKITTDAAHWGEPLSPLLASRPSLATPVPEPEAYAMVIAGLVMVAAARRRVRRHTGLQRPARRTG